MFSFWQFGRQKKYICQIKFLLYLAISKPIHINSRPGFTPAMVIMTENKDLAMVPNNSPQISLRLQRLL